MSATFGSLLLLLLLGKFELLHGELYTVARARAHGPARELPPLITFMRNDTNYVEVFLQSSNRC